VLHSVVLVCAALLWLLPARSAQAYPWMIKHGYTNCGACHADPSGGELLTSYGHGISWEALSTHWSSSSGGSSWQQQKAVAALARAAKAKSAPRKKIVAEEVNLDEEPAPAKPAKPAKPAPADEDAGEEAATEESAGEEAAADETPAEEPAPAAEEEKTEEAPAASGSAYEGMSPITGPLFGLLKPSDDFLIGGSLRFATIFKPKPRFFPMQLDVYGQARFFNRLRANVSLGVIKVAEGAQHGRAAQVTAGQGDGYNLISRTHWLGFEFGDGQHLLRVGRMNLPFGLRMSEHVMWVRERTQTDRESDQQHGASLYLGFDNLRLEVMGILGNYQINPDSYRERGYSGYAEYVVAEKIAVGVNSLYTYAGNDRVFPEGLKTARQAHGMFLRAGPTTAVSILAEANVLLRSRRSTGYVAFLQVDGEPFQGVHVIGSAEVSDQGYPKLGGPGQATRVPGQGKPELGGWLSLQWFVTPHFDVRLDGIIRRDKALLWQAHIYL